MKYLLKRTGPIYLYFRTFYGLSLWRISENCESFRVIGPVSESMLLFTDTEYPVSISSFFPLHPLAPS
jgi:hypothetical protein